MNIPRLFIILAFFAIYPTILANPVIVLSMQRTQEHERLYRQLKKPGAIAKNRLNHLLSAHPFAGIFATYAGFLEVADSAGQFIFVRKHSQPFIYLLITEKIMPIVMLANTVHHWELIEKVPARMFKFEKKEDSSLMFWHVSEVPLPENNIVPLEAMVLFTQPKYIEVQSGIFATTDTPHLILPTIYVKKRKDIIKEALYLLNLRHLFAHTSLYYHVGAQRYEIVLPS